jgi:hypothetical protein
MWRELASDFPGVELHEPATESSLTEIENRLGQRIPAPLGDLLMETDGIADQYGTELVWDAAKISHENSDFRSNEDFRSLYMPFNPLLFFGDNGGGDQFAFVRTPERGDVFVWDHETDSRTWVSPSLESYLRSALTSDGEDWYR